MLETRSTSLKYCSVWFSLVKYYGPQLIEAGSDAAGEPSLAETAERVLQGCTSFVRKPALATLRKLRQPETMRILRALEPAPS